MQVCLFCGGDTGEPGHAVRCDGRQGHVEALYGSMGDVPYEMASETSAAAARAIDESDLSRLEALVFDVLKAAPRTCDAVEVATGLSHQTTSARLRGLVLRDQIIDSGIRRQTRSGRLAVVWRIKQASDRQGVA